MMQILYFGRVRSRIGMPGEEISLPEGVSTVAGLMEWLKGRGERHARAFEDADAVRAAVNQEIAPPDAAVAENDEVAFFPPMTGG